MWPGLVVAGKYANFNPFQMVFTNFMGASWTFYNVVYGGRSEN